MKQDILEIVFKEVVKSFIFYIHKIIFQTFQIF